MFIVDLSNPLYQYFLRLRSENPNIFSLMKSLLTLFTLMVSHMSMNVLRFHFRPFTKLVCLNHLYNWRMQHKVVGSYSCSLFIRLLSVWCLVRLHQWWWRWCVRCSLLFGNSNPDYFNLLSQFVDLIIGVICHITLSSLLIPPLNNSFGGISNKIYTFTCNSYFHKLSGITNNN